MIQDKIDQWKSDLPGSFYRLVAAQDGYIAVHHGEVSHEPTGDPDKDLMYSRQCRFYNTNETERRRGTSQPFLLQTYIRDTGEVLFDLSVPIVYKDKQWGSVLNGLPLELLL